MLTNVKTAFDPTKILALIQALGQMAPVMLAFIQSIIDAFKPKMLKAANMGDCCPKAREMVDCAKGDYVALGGWLARLDADPCDPVAGDEARAKVACLVANLIALATCDK